MLKFCAYCSNFVTMATRFGRNRSEKLVFSSQTIKNPLFDADTLSISLIKALVIFCCYGNKNP